MSSHCSYIFLFYFAILLSAALCSKQRVQVKGKLFCGNATATGITVKLVEKDTFKDDTLGKMETGPDGGFALEGVDDEIGTIDPELKIYHRCNSMHICKRRWVIKIPKQYITAPYSPPKWFDIGMVNLEMRLEEDKKCLPV